MTTCQQQNYRQVFGLVSYVTERDRVAETRQLIDLTQTANRIPIPLSFTPRHHPSVRHAFLYVFPPSFVQNERVVSAWWPWVSYAQLQINIESLARCSGREFS